MKKLALIFEFSLSPVLVLEGIGRVEGGIKRIQRKTFSWLLSTFVAFSFLVFEKLRAGDVTEERHVTSLHDEVRTPRFKMELNYEINPASCNFIAF